MYNFVTDKRKKIIDRMVLQILQEHGIHDLPIDLMRIIRQHKDWEVYGSQQAYHEGIIKTKPDNEYEGELIYSNGVYYIVFNERHPYEKQCWTIAHEIAHYYLSHRGAEKVVETEANYFARQLLKPLPVLSDANITDPIDIAKYCMMSKKAGGYRATELAEYDENKAKNGQSEEDIAFLRQFGRMDTAEEIFPFAWLKILA